MGHKVGKAFAEFRRATTEFRMNLEREVAATEVKEVVDEVVETVREAKGAVARDLRIEPNAPEPDDDPGQG
jgi:Sec-independent protein translocase protein TatA